MSSEQATQNDLPIIKKVKTDVWIVEWKLERWYYTEFNEALTKSIQIEQEHKINKLCTKLWEGAEHADGWE